MKRRNFLKRIGQTIAGLAVAPSVVKAKEPELPKITAELPASAIKEMLAECEDILTRDFTPQEHWQAMDLIDSHTEMGMPINELTAIQRVLCYRIYRLRQRMD